MLLEVVDAMSAAHISRESAVVTISSFTDDAVTTEEETVNVAEDVVTVADVFGSANTRSGAEAEVYF
jgi:hypothetical protein